jgi:uncharacterized protein YjbI with pentapeptide repeats
MLSQAMLKTADFSKAKLCGVNFSGADCTEAKFTGAALGGGRGLTPRSCRWPRST